MLVVWSIKWIIALKYQKKYFNRIDYNKLTKDILNEKITQKNCSINLIFST